MVTLQEWIRLRCSEHRNRIQVDVFKRLPGNRGTKSTRSTRFFGQLPRFSVRNRIRRGRRRMDWQSTAEGETILQHFYNPQTCGRKFFGLLERPAVPSTVEEVSYKLFVVGNSGIGKTATVTRLAGLKTSCQTYYETLGVQKTNVYWPVKIWDKIIMFKLQFWDAGKNSLKKYGHILSGCQSKADALVFVFSFAEKSSFSDLPKIIPNYAKSCENPAVVAVGTRFKSSAASEVTQYDVQEFEMKTQIPVLKIENKWTPGRNEVHEVSPILNVICERLWLRDQDYLHKQGVA